MLGRMELGELLDVRASLEERVGRVARAGDIASAARALAEDALLALGEVLAVGRPGDRVRAAEIVLELAARGGDAGGDVDPRELARRVVVAVGRDVVSSVMAEQS